MMPGGLGRTLVVFGFLIIAIGGILIALEKGLPQGLPHSLQWLGRLPGDIFIQRKNFTVYFPIATSILISMILSAVLWLVMRR